MGVNIQLKLTIPSFHCFANVDQNKFSQVIRNLISNALKFSQKPGIVNVEVDVVPMSFYEYLNTTILHSSKRKTNKCNFIRSNQVTFDSATENVVAIQENNSANKDTDYYLRLTVTDDGAGISLVRTVIIILFKMYSRIFLYRFYF